MLQADGTVRGVLEGNRVVFSDNSTIDAGTPSYAKAFHAGVLLHGPHPPRRQSTV